MNALAELIAGNARPQASPPVRRPMAAILTCVDERVVPEAVFGRPPGDLYCVRIAGHVLTPEVVASLEIGIGLGVPIVLVLGHTDCAAVRLSRGRGREHYGITRHIAWATRNVPVDAPLDEAIEANVRHVVAELRSRLAVRVEGAMLDVATGRVRVLNC